LSSEAEIRDSAGPLILPDTRFNPGFFLAKASKGWRPRVVAVYRAGVVVGVMYANERVISGVPTGVVYADGSLDDILLGGPEHREQAFRAGVETLLASSGIRGVRLRLLRGSSELTAIRRLVASRQLDSRYFRIKHQGSELWKFHAHVALPGSYEKFLAQLGGTTRHNFRYYRRRFEKSGHALVQNLSVEELRSAAHYLGDKSKFAEGTRPNEMEGKLRTVEASGRPLAIGLRHRDGKWLSVIGGWYRSERAVLLFQMNNDRDFGRDSLSVVLRGFLVENLISQGLRELVVWGDTGPPLSRYATYRPTISVHLDRPTLVWRTARFLISRGRSWMPKRVAWAAQWLAPVVAYAIGGWAPAWRVKIQGTFTC
jgi:hypothetical protein